MNGWFWIDLRNGKEELAEGEAERDRKMARKTPRAIGWRVAKIHQCSICLRHGPWTSDWTWFGSYADLDDGKPIERLCSKPCRDAWREMVREAGAAPGVLSKWSQIQDEPIGSQKERSDRWKRKWDAERDMRAHRAFPMPQWPVERAGMGWCRWCGLEISNATGKHQGKRSHNRTWHRYRYGDERDCFREWLLHTDSEAQFWHLVQRDGPGCATCGIGVGRWVSAGGWHLPSDERGVTSLRWSIKLEVDHVVPLWRSSDFPEVAERRALHGPINLWLLCQPCHRRKSAMEAAERAESRR